MGFRGVCGLLDLARAAEGDGVGGRGAEPESARDRWELHSMGQAPGPGDLGSSSNSAVNSLCDLGRSLQTGACQTVGCHPRMGQKLLLAGGDQHQKNEIRHSTKSQSASHME